MHDRPVIGIVGHGLVVSRPFGELPILGTPQAYVAGVRAAGGTPVVLPPQTAVDLVDRVDALVLTGGGDVDPALYGSGTPGRGVDPPRDCAELAVIRAAAAARTRLLAVCRGMQLLAVAFGGTLVPELAASHVLPGTGHHVSTTAGSLTAALLGPRPRVSSLHHQAVRAPTAPWRATARADDGVVEAMEWAGPGRWDVVAVQWHPELDDPTGPALFGWLAGQPAPAYRGASSASTSCR